jgi:predicted glycoside hydrolase/deacetylase ChbG (UPF0249 family)
MPRLIVNADDYGLTRGVNEAIQQVFDGGGLTSATLMAGAAQAENAASFAIANPSLGVGCHIVLLDGKPAAPTAEVASLLQPGTENFYLTLGAFLRALFAGRIRRAHIATEASAQLQRLRSLGIQPTHVDTHKHTHMFPQVLEPVLDAAMNAGVFAVRNPMEPAWAVAATPGAGMIRKREVSVLRMLYRERFLAAVRQRQFVTTDGALGVAATGSLREADVRALLGNLPEGTWELVCHPGYVDDELAHIKTRLVESREIEAAVLMKLPDIVSSDTRLMHYGELSA